MKYKTRARDCQLIVRAKTSFGEMIDEKELDRFSRIYLRGFLKPKLLKGNLVEYTGPIGISLYQKLGRRISKRDFLFILEQIVVAVQKLHANNMSLNNLVMNLQHIYMNDVTKEIQFIYLPTMRGLRNPTLVNFFETIAYSAKPADESDKEVISRFVYFFKSMDPFDLNKIELFVAKEDRSVVNTIKKHNAGQSGFMTSKPKQYYDHYDEKAKIDDESTGLLYEMENDEPTGLLVEEDDSTGLLFENDESTGLLEYEDDATGLLDNIDDDATGLLTDTDDDATGLLVENNVSVRFPTLFRILTEETISVNKPVFRLGKEKSYVDYFVTNNIAVSRSHADIITRGDKYFVKDLNSKNRTYINNKDIPVLMEVEIRDGDRLKLGNEEFIFNV